MQTTGVASFISFPVQVAAIPTFFPTRFVTSCSRLGCAPETGLACDVTPVDYAAKERN